MRTFSYLFRRLLHSGLTWLLAAILLFFLLPATLVPSLFPTPYSNQTKDPSSRTADFTFQLSTEFQHLQLNYRREDYLQSLSEYLVYLRREKFALNPDDPSQKQWIEHLQNQEIYHLDQLNLTHGLIDQEKYYLSSYAPLWTVDLLQNEGFYILDRELLMKPETWEPIIGAALQSEEAHIVAKGRNLQAQLPLVLNGSSASAKLLFLIQASRFLLALIPVMAFYILFGVCDRNLSASKHGASTHKLAAIFTYTGLFLIVSRLLWFWTLNLRYGDAEGAMLLAPVWSAFSQEAASSVLSLHNYLFVITLIDLAFAFFIAALLALVHKLTGRWHLSIGLTGFSLLLAQTMSPAQTACLSRLSGPLSYLKYPVNLGAYPLSSNFSFTPKSFLGSPLSTSMSFIVWGLLCMGTIIILDIFLPKFKRYHQL